MMKDEFSINLAEENESLGFDLKEQYVAGTSDYNKLKNKPTLNGNEIIPSCYLSNQKDGK